MPPVMTYRSAMAVYALMILLPFVGAYTTILTYSDSSCQTVLSTLTPEDAVGSGPCHQVALNYSSFMVTRVGLDCGVTIYGNVPFCSSPVLELAVTGSCYNASWVYYSVDNCAPASSVSASLSPTGTPDSSSSSSSSGVNVGAVVGGSIAGTTILGCLAIYFCAIRPRQRRRLSTAPPPPPRKEGMEHVERPGLLTTDMSKTTNYPYVEVSPDSPYVYEMSPDHILEVHGEASVRHELPS